MVTAARLPTRWEFTQHPDHTWTWSALSDDEALVAVSRAGMSLSAALRSASIQGFDPERHYHVIRNHGGATHVHPSDSSSIVWNE
jgi:hypothetical protein